MVATSIIFIRQWIEGLEPLYKILIMVAVGAFLLALIAYIFNWREKRKFEKIPDLLERMDKLALDYIEDFEFTLTPEDWNSLYGEYGSLLKIDFGLLKNALLKKDKEVLEREFQRITKAYDRHLNPSKKLEQSLTDLLDMGSILDCYNVRNIRSLQRKAPSANISNKVNEYYSWSEGFYCLLLSMKPLTEQPILRELMPIKVKAKKSQVRPLIERQTSTLISAVRESIEDYKQKRKGK